ncbi:hypothetical protein [Halorubellus sp. PRR65]|uniref:hypothetical protein n=1 Tax=Halorubellus sp. PRR65 TaxID=3098148 RepID=UPI002B2612B6|nr:hypothetical protein [Halorubellus sp. PRR65]
MRPPPHVPSLAFALGVCLVVAAVVLGVGAVRFEFAYVGVTATPGDADWVLSYGDLTSADKELVTAAIAGDAFVTDSLGALPGPGRGSIAVFYAGEHHAFTRRTYFDAGTDLGVASIATAVSGLAAVGLAFRTRERRRRSHPV